MQKLLLSTFSIAHGLRMDSAHSGGWVVPAKAKAWLADPANAAEAKRFKDEVDQIKNAMHEADPWGTLSSGRVGRMASIAHTPQVPIPEEYKQRKFEAELSKLEFVMEMKLQCGEANGFELIDEKALPSEKYAIDQRNLITQRTIMEHMPLEDLKAYQERTKVLRYRWSPHEDQYARDNMYHHDARERMDITDHPLGLPIQEDREFIEDLIARKEQGEFPSSSQTPDEETEA